MICQFITAHWKMLSVGFVAAGGLVVKLIIKSRTQEVAERFLNWIVTSSKNRVQDLTICPDDIDNVFPNTFIEKFIYRSLFEDEFKNMVIRRLIKAGRLEKISDGKFNFSLFDNQDLR